MKSPILKPAILITLLSTGACTAMKESPAVSYIDPVCNMKVNSTEAFKYKYNGQTYYFDSYNCRETFKMNPENILKKANCTTK